MLRRAAALVVLFVASSVLVLNLTEPRPARISVPVVGDHAADYLGRWYTPQGRLELEVLRTAAGVEAVVVPVPGLTALSARADGIALETGAAEETLLQSIRWPNGDPPYGSSGTLMSSSYWLYRAPSRAWLLRQWVLRPWHRFRSSAR